MQPVSPSSTSSASKKQSMMQKIKAAWQKGDETVNGNLFGSYFFPSSEVSKITAKHL